MCRYLKLRVTTGRVGFNFETNASAALWCRRASAQLTRPSQDAAAPSSSSSRPLSTTTTTSAASSASVPSPRTSKNAKLREQELARREELLCAREQQVLDLAEALRARQTAFWKHGRERSNSLVMSSMDEEDEEQARAQETSQVRRRRLKRHPRLAEYERCFFIGCGGGSRPPARVVLWGNRYDE